MSSITFFFDEKRAIKKIKNKRLLLSGILKNLDKYYDVADTRTKQHIVGSILN
jgi:hypothetical protein